MESCRILNLSKILSYRCILIFDFIYTLLPVQIDQSQSSWDILKFVQVQFSGHHWVSWSSFNIATQRGYGVGLHQGMLWSWSHAVLRQWIALKEATKELTLRIGCWSRSWEVWAVVSVNSEMNRQLQLCTMSTKAHRSEWCQFKDLKWIAQFDLIARKLG